MKIQTSLSRPEGVHPNIFAKVLALKAGYEGDPWEFVQVVMQELLEAREVLDMVANPNKYGIKPRVDYAGIRCAARDAIAKADARLGTAIKEGK